MNCQGEAQGGLVKTGETGEGARNGEERDTANDMGIPDGLWQQIEPALLAVDQPKRRGRKRADPRKMLEGVILRMRSGCQWNHLPKELGDDSTIRRTFSVGWSWGPWNRSGPS